MKTNFVLTAILATASCSFVNAQQKAKEAFLQDVVSVLVAYEGAGKHYRYQDTTDMSRTCGIYYAAAKEFIYCDKSGRPSGTPIKIESEKDLLDGSGCCTETKLTGTTLDPGDFQNFSGKFVLVIDSAGHTFIKFRRPGSSIKVKVLSDGKMVANFRAGSDYDVTLKKCSNCM